MHRELCFLFNACCCTWSNGILLHVVEGKLLQPKSIDFVCNKCVVFGTALMVSYSCLFMGEFVIFLSFVVQGWSLSDVMFVTKHNMANAVATVSKQLENVNEALSVSSLSNKFLDITSRIYLASHIGVGCIAQTLNKTL